MTIITTTTGPADAIAPLIGTTLSSYDIRFRYGTSSVVGAYSHKLGRDAAVKILPLADAKERFQREYINEVLALNNGNRTKTARDLGVDPRTIFRHLEKEEGERNSDA